MLRDEEFSSRAKVDRYGRKLVNRSSEKDLERFYRLDEEDLSEDTESNDEDEVQRELRTVNEDDGDAQSSSSSEESESEDDELEEEEIFGLEEQEPGADGVPTGEVTSRLAVVNLDWDNIRAADLMAVFSSFVPSTGRIQRISIYPSDFGRERMEQEDMEGPPKDIFPTRVINEAEETSGEENHSENDSEEDNEEKIKKSMLADNEGVEFNSAKLRRYQLERLRYFFAIIICSSSAVAETIYNAVDGTEYLTTANFFDLRFVPNETDFSTDRPRDQCERIPDGYRPNEFVTDALQHSKIKLTWDADDPERKEAQKRAFSGSRAAIDENDLKAYLGSDSSDDDEIGGEEESLANGGATGSAPDAPRMTKKEVQRQRMRALLGLGTEPEVGTKSRTDKKAPVGEVQVTFQAAFSEKPGEGSVFENEPEKDETTREKYVRKERERKVRRKEKMKGARNGDAGVVAENGTGDTTAPDATGATGDDAFDDDFFEAEESITTTQLKKKRKRPDSPDPATDGSALDALRTTADSLDDSTMQHFDTNLLSKADKMARKSKKSKKRHVTERQKEALEAKERDRFEINVGDPRFDAVFESADFAIDPSHKGFKETEGMRKLLDEGRRKRDGRFGDTGGGEGVERTAERSHRTVREGRGGR